MDATFVIVAAALALGLAFAGSSSATLRPEKARLHAAGPVRRPVRSRGERLAAIAREINAYLLILAIGLGALDLAAAAVLGVSRLPESATWQSGFAAMGDANTAATQWSFQ